MERWIIREWSVTKAGEWAQPPDPLGAKSINQMLTGAARGEVTPTRTAPPEPMTGLTCTTSHWKNVTGLGRAT